MNQLLFSILICFLAGAGAGLGTGFAGLSAATVISPMLIAFLDIPAYDAIGIALASDVLASAVSARTYAKNGSIDIKNGLAMMAGVLSMTVVGSWLSTYVDNNTLGNFSVVMALVLGLRFLLFPLTSPRQQTQTAAPAPQGAERAGRRRGGWADLRLFRRGRRHDDAHGTYHGAGVRAENSGGNQRFCHDFFGPHRRGKPFFFGGHAFPAPFVFLHPLHPFVGADRRQNRHSRQPAAAESAYRHHSYGPGSGPFEN